MPRQHAVCLGDSITRGKLSVDYVNMLSGRTSLAPFTFTNAGVNGDLTENVVRRLDAAIDLRPHVVTVLIGTNDVNASMSAKNSGRAVRMNKLSARPTIEVFGDNVATIVDRLATESSARIGLLSLPAFGEDVGSESVRRSQQYSAVLEQIAESRGVT